MIDAMTEAVDACRDDVDRLSDLTTELAIALANDEDMMRVALAALVAALSVPMITDAQADHVLEKIVYGVHAGRVMNEGGGEA